MGSCINYSLLSSDVTDTVYIKSLGVLRNGRRNETEKVATFYDGRKEKNHILF